MLLVPILAALVPSAFAAQAPELTSGIWHAALDGPGGEIPFDLRIDVDEDGGVSGVLLLPRALSSEGVRHYGADLEEPLRVTREGDVVTLSIDHYDSHLTGELGADGTTLAGMWRKRSGPDSWAELPFRATTDEPPFVPQKRGGPDGPLNGRYRVAFESSPVPAVMILREGFLGDVRGTVLTDTGDYRFLTGEREGDAFHLTTFDGAHAFRFEARITAREALADEPRPVAAEIEGDFWSRDTWHETFTAERDPDAALPDPFTQTVWDDSVALADLVFQDLEGNARSVADLARDADAILLQVFGTWCPNCNDETRFLVELHDRFSERGLAIVGLAFELTGEPERDARQVRGFAQRHGATYPMLLAGGADKAGATEALAALDRVRSYPTTIFLTGDGRVRAVHSGFAGPATGPAHESLRAEYERLIAELLEGDGSDASDATWRWLLEHDLFDHQAFAGGEVRFHEQDGARRALVRTFGSGVPEIGRKDVAVRIAGDTVWIEDELWRLDRQAQALLSPTDAGARLAFDPWSAPRGVADRYDLGQGEDLDAVLVRALKDGEPVVRREAAWHLARERMPLASSRLTEVVPLIGDPDRRVRLVAAWAVGAVGEPEALDALLAGSASRDAALRRECARSLAALVRLDRAGPRAEDVAERLGELTRDPDPTVRAAAGGGDPSGRSGR